MDNKDRELDNTGDDGMTEFETVGHEETPGLIGEFCYFLKHNKKWWLVPFLLVIALLTALSFLTGSGAAPFIYSLF